jgi:hypothetical protein
LIKALAQICLIISRQFALGVSADLIDHPAKIDQAIHLAERTPNSQVAHPEDNLSFLSGSFKPCPKTEPDVAD